MTAKGITMDNANTGWLFYNSYYNGFTNNDWKELVASNEDTKFQLSGSALKGIESANKAIKSSRINTPENECSINTKSRKWFELKTTYPGLLVGSGYNHSAGSIEGEFKLGFYFDYTTGKPVVPGSSVKGLLRSAFPNRNNNKLSEEYKKERTFYIKEKLKSLGINVEPDDQIDLIESEIFEGRKEDRNISVYGRDIFFDAYIEKSENENNIFLEEDFITPHKHRTDHSLDEFADPLPLMFLKVCSEVTFIFQFDLKDSAIPNAQKDGSLLNAKQKSDLFKEIILDLGIGSKTNVGYGQFDKTKQGKKADEKAAKQKSEKELKQKEQEKQKQLDAMSPVDKLFENFRQGPDDDLTVANKLTNALQKEDKNIDSSLYVEIAGRIKEIRIKQNKWTKQKKRQKKRVQFIKSILGEN